MGKKKSSNSARRRESQRLREEARLVNRVKRHPRALVSVAVGIAILVGIAALSQSFDLTNYNRCFSTNDGPALQSYRIAVFIQIGDAIGLGAHFIRINNGTGNVAGNGIQCKFSLHVPSGDPNTRGPFYTPLLVESPYTTAKHQYTLGDFFMVWGEWLHVNDLGQPDAGLAFREGKVSYYATPNVEVRVVENVNSDTYNPWSDNFTLSTAFGATPLRAGSGYYIIVHDPWTDTGNAY